MNFSELRYSLPFYMVSKIEPFSWNLRCHAEQDVINRQAGEIQFIRCARLAEYHTHYNNATYPGEEFYRPDWHDTHRGVRTRNWCSDHAHKNYDEMVHGHVRNPEWVNDVA